LSTYVTAFGAGLEQMRNHQYKTDLVIRVLIAFEGIEREINRIQRVFNGAVTQGRLMPELVTKKGITKTFNDLQERVTKAGYRLLIEGAINLHQCDISFYTTGKGIAISVEVPISAEEPLMEVYEYRPMPIPIEDNNDLYLTVQPKETILVVNNENTRFQSLTKEQLNACKKIREIFYCKNLNGVRVANEHARKDHVFCLLSLKQQRYGEVRRFCPTKVIPRKDWVRQRNAPESSRQRRDTRVTFSPRCTRGTANSLFKRRPDVSAKEAAENKEWDYDPSRFVPRTTFPTYAAMVKMIYERGFSNLALYNIEPKQTLGQKEGGTDTDIPYGRAGKDGWMRRARKSRKHIQTARAEKKKEEAEREQHEEDEETFERFIKFYETTAQAKRERQTRVVETPTAEIHLTQARIQSGTFTKIRGSFEHAEVVFM
jgi:hypothetical protein